MLINILKTLIIIFLLFQIGYSKEPVIYGDNASLSGYIKDSETDEVLIGAVVSLEGTKFGAYTNKSGFFSINNIPPGKYKIIISLIGYERLVNDITFKTKESKRETFLLKPAQISTEEIEVVAEREIEKREISISKINIPVKQLKEIRIGGESDVFRSLQLLPGILTSSQLSSGLFVRGGSPDQNLVLLDGNTVYNPTHLFGFISTFNTDAIKDVELIKGGFSAEYGGRLSAVLNITQKDGNRNKIEGLGSIGMITSRLALEGPLGNGSWFIGGRRTYFELVKLILPQDPQNPLPDFNFFDVNGKITQNLSENDKLYLSGFISQDNLGFGGRGLNMNLSIGNQLISGRWNHIFGDNLFSSLLLSLSNYYNNFNADQSGYKVLMENEITDYTLKGTVEWFNSEVLSHKFGFESSYLKFNFLQNFTGDTDSTKSESSGGTVNLKVDDWVHSIYSQVNYILLDILTFQAGLRLNYWYLRDKILLDPRIAVRYQINDKMAIKTAWGIFSQNLRLATQNDFSFFDTWMPTDSTVLPSRAMHFIISLETEPFDGIIANFDVYYKQMENVSELNMNALKAENVADVFYIGDAKSYGAEIFVQKKYGKLTGWFGYALGFIRSRFDSINNGETFRPKYDRLHDFKLVAQYNIDEHWDIGASFTFQSGQSYTGATSRFQTRLPGQNWGRGKIVPSQRFGLRLPASHQLNLNASYSFKMFGLPAKIIADIYNVYNHKDIWFRYYNTTQKETTVEDVSLLPILPTISFEIKF